MNFWNRTANIGCNNTINIEVYRMVPAQRPPKLHFKGTSNMHAHYCLIQAHGAMLPFSMEFCRSAGISER